MIQQLGCYLHYDCNEGVWIRSGSATSNCTLWDVRTVQRALLAVREDQKSDWLKKKSAEVAKADGEDEDNEDTDIEDEGE